MPRNRGILLPHVQEATKYTRLKVHEGFIYVCLQNVGLAIISVAVPNAFAQPFKGG